MRTPPDRLEPRNKIEFETLFRSSSVAMVFAQDAHCHVVLRNPAMDRMIPPELDWNTWQLPDGRAALLFQDGTPLAIDQQPLRRAALRGETTHQLEIEVRLPGKSPLFALVSADPLHDAAGQPCGAIGAAFDITARKHAELDRRVTLERALAARHDAEAANRAKDEVVAMLGHELRNPLNAISTAVEVLNRAAPGAREAVSARDIIGRQIHRLAHLLDDLVEVGRVLADEVQLQRLPIELDALVRQSLAAAEARAAVKRQTLRAVLETVWVDADARRISQALERLLDNAFKATPADGTIEVHLREVKGPDGRCAVLLVADSGLGIDPDLLDRMFDSFVQRPPGPDRPGGALGIGLTLVRRLAELHGGTVQAYRGVTGEPSATHHAPTGSVFELRLPAIEPASLERPSKTAERKRASVGVIDDNPDAVFGMCAMLEFDGHVVSTAEDGPSGLAMLLRDAPDIAIVDIGLPGFDGYELARRCRSAGYRGRLIALSGYGQEQEVQRSIASGFDAHLVKPIEPDQLARLLAD